MGRRRAQPSGHPRHRPPGRRHGRQRRRSRPQRPSLRPAATGTDACPANHPRRQSTGPRSHRDAVALPAWLADQRPSGRPATRHFAVPSGLVTGQQAAAEPATHRRQTDAARSLPAPPRSTARAPAHATRRPTPARPQFSTRDTVHTARPTGLAANHQPFRPAIGHFAQLRPLNPTAAAQPSHWPLCVPTGRPAQLSTDP